MPSARAIGVGAFVLGGVLLFSVALFLVGNRRMLFADTFTTYAEFKSISGIEVGSAVRVAGMAAGEVKDIEVPRSPDRRFRLEMEVREDLHGLVRTDSVASIQTQGLVGAQFVQIAAGTTAAPPVQAGGTILGREPFDFSDLLLQMSDAVVRINETIVVLRARIEDTIGTIQKVAADAGTLLTQMSDDVRMMSRSGARIMADSREIIEGVRAGKGTIGRLFADDQLYRDAARAVADAQKAVASIREASEKARDLLGREGGKDGQIAALTANLTETLGNARESMANLADATEAMKHNFLLRGFFNRRGYFSLDELSPASYRAGALASDGRQPLRLWLAAPLVFAQGPDGGEVLSEAGKARLEGAMGQLLDHRKEGPLIVEGYAEGPDTAARYLKAQARATLARNYLIERFGLDPASTGTIALGNEATDSPAGDRWDGLGLALFVRPSALQKQ